MGVEFIDENKPSRQTARVGYSGLSGNSYGTGQVGQNSGGRGIAGWVIKRGWAKNRDQANLILIALSIVFFAIAFVVPMFFKNDGRVKIYREDIDTEGMTEAELEEVFKLPSRNYR